MPRQGGLPYGAASGTPAGRDPTRPAEEPVPDRPATPSSALGSPAGVEAPAAPPAGSAPAAAVQRRHIGSGRRPAWSTTTAAGLLGLLAAGFAFVGLGMLDAEIGTGTEASRRLVLMELGNEGGRTLLAFSGIVVLVTCAVVAAIVVGLLGRRAWAREAGMLVAVLFALLSLGVGASGLAADPPARAAWAGISVGLAHVAVVALLLLPATADDLDRAELRRRLGRPRR